MPSIEQSGQPLLRAALQEALDTCEKPEIFNTDQGAQFNATAFTSVLEKRDIRIIMNSKGRWRDNISTLPDFPPPPMRI